MTDYDDYYDAAKKDGEPVIQGEHGGCIRRYYDDKAREARELSEQLERAIAQKAPLAEIGRIAARLEAAYYVGD
jgi:hypothetical protein